MALALYRKWRPNTFSDLIGQEAIITTLMNQIKSGRVAHAYLFCGSRGTGKTSTAKVLARAVNCTSPIDGDLCGECEACVAMGDENNMDIIEMDAASNNGVDEIRDLREKVKYPPSVGKYRVYIIDEVHMLSAGAFNALLKTLEEPPPYIVFILATTEVQKLPATILSRCQRFDFKRIGAKTIAGRLSEVAREAGGNADESALMAIAREAQGGMRDAISLLDLCLSYGEGHVTIKLVQEVLGASAHEFISGFIGSLITKDTGKCLTDIDRLMRDGHEPSVFLRDITGYLRALILAKACEGLADLLEIAEEDAIAYKAQSETVELPALVRCLDLFLQAENELKWAGTSRIALEMAVVRACYPETEQNIEALTDRIGKLEGALSALHDKMNTINITGAYNGSPNTSAASTASTAVNAEKQPVPSSASLPAQIGAEPVQGANEQAAPKSDNDIWLNGLKAAKALNGKFITFLSGCTFGGISGDVLTINFDKTKDIYIKILESPEYMTKLTESFSKAAGRAITVNFASGTETIKSTPLGDDNPNLIKMIDFFGRENVEIKDEI